jgi:phospholipase/lecithinase/hemolysin
VQVIERSKLDGFVKSPSAALRFTFVVATYPQVRLTPQFLRALHLGKGDALKLFS